MAIDKLPAAGALETPPANAPSEVSQPLGLNAGGIAPATNPRTGEPYATEAWHTMSPADRARHNERELAPLTWNTLPKTGGVAEAVEAAGEGKIDPFYQRLREGVAVVDGQRILRRATGRPPVPVLADSPDAEAIPDDIPTTKGGLTPDDDLPRSMVAIPADPTAPIDDSIYPAGSNSDSPSRGIPRGTIDPGKAVTGGFGDQASLQYFALDGRELLALVESLMDELHARIQNDLRFNEAICYPQVSVRVAIEVTGFAQDQGFMVDTCLPAAHEARTKTPLDIARSVADEVCFVVLAERRETDDQGNSLLPPDAVRQALGLARPGKRIVKGLGGQESFVDVS